jgi:hypothetical protein
MRFRVASVVMAAVVLGQVACDNGGEALVAVIQLEPGTPATCLSLTVVEPDTTPARLLKQTQVPRVAGQDEYRVAVYRAGLPEEVVLQAQARFGSGCSEPLGLVSSSPAVQQRFAAGAPAQVPLFIPRPTVPPDALAIRVASPVLAAGDCAQATVEPTLAGSAAPVLSDTAVSFSFQPASGLTAHLDGTCTTPAGGGTLPAGSSLLPLQLHGLTEGQYTFTAGAAGLDSGTITLNVVLTPAAALAFGTQAWTALSGACVGPVQVRAVDSSGNPALPATDTAVTLSADSTGVTFATDSQCVSAATSVLLPAGAPGAAFYFRPRAAGPVTLRADSAGPLGAATQVEQIVPNVRSGSCAMAAGTYAIACPIGGPGVFDLSKAFLVVQAISNDDTPSGAQVRCRLADAGTIDCSRAGTTGFADVGWQLVELPAGVRVQRITNNYCNLGNPMTLPQPFDPAQTFVLFTHEGAGGNVGSDDYRTVRLIGNQQVEVLDFYDCGNGITDVQVVELQGASVERGAVDAGYVSSVVVNTASTADLTRTFLLHSVRSVDGSNLCGYQFRGELTSASTITFTRGNGDAICAAPDIASIAWERIQLPAGATVQQIPVAMADGQAFAAVPANPFDPARTFALSSNQFNSGAGYGETSYNLDDQPGAAGARHVLAAGNRLELTRAVDAGTSRWTSYVVQLP